MSKKSFEFDNNNPGATVLRSIEPIVIEKPRSRASAELPALIVDIIARCLEKDPANRYQSALDIVKELKVALQDGGAKA